MEIGANSYRKLRICMLLPLTYEPDMLIYPRISIFSNVVHFGHQVTWIISSKEGAGYQQLSIDGIEVYSVPRHRYFPGNFIVAESLNEILHAVARMRFTSRLFKSSKYDVIFTRHSAKRPFDGLIAFYIKWRYKVAFAFEIASPLEQIWLSIKMERRRPRLMYYLIAWVSNFIATRLFHSSDLILPVSKYLKDHLVKQGIPESKILAVPVGVDAGALSRQANREIVDKYQLSSSKVVIYQGTLGKTRQLSVLLEAFLIVKQAVREAKLLIVGEGSDKENLEELAIELGIKDDVIFTGQVLQSEVPDFIAAANIGVSPIPPLAIYKVSSPIKLLEYMAMQKPVVANREIPEHQEVLEQSGGGISVPFTPQAFASAIIKLLDNPEKATEMGRKGREWVANNRSYEILARQVEKEYLELLYNRH